MNYKILILFFLLLSCATLEEPEKEKDKVIFKKSFSNKGFALVYNNNLKKLNKVSKSIDERSLIVFQNNLLKNTYVKIINLNNDKSIIAQVGNYSKYPNFYNSVISKRISEEIELDLNDPYVEIKEINNTTTFVANKAKTFDEEKNVADKAPVENITIKKIGISDSKKNNKIKKKNFNYIVKIADFYFVDTAKLLKKRIINELKLKNVHIDTISKTKFRVYLGPYNNLDSLKKAFNDISLLNFENIEFLKL